jgi:hypothetical protein
VTGFSIEQPIGVGFKFQPWKIFKSSPVLQQAATQAVQQVIPGAQQTVAQATQAATSAVTQAIQPTTPAPSTDDSSSSDSSGDAGVSGVGWPGVIAPKSQ